MDLKICPITKQECRKNCVWYIEHQELCAIILISEDIRAIVENIEEIRNENEN